MIKSLIHNISIASFVFFFFQDKAQIINFSTGMVASYATYKNDTSQAILIDTVVGQYRSFAIDSIEKKMGVEWLVEKDTLRVQYHIDKIYITENYNSSTKMTDQYVNFLAFDNENYPLLLLFPKEDKDFIYVYYYWNNKANAFLKCEKIVIVNNKNIVLH